MDRPKNTPRPRETDARTPTPVVCRRCQNTETVLMGRMENAKEAIYRCTTCGHVFTTP